MEFQGRLSDAKFVKDMQSEVSYFKKNMAEKFVRYVPTLINWVLLVIVVVVGYCRNT
jgi:hypothetical protein